MLIVDRSLEPIPVKIVGEAAHGELIMKRLIQKNAKFYLQAENSLYPKLKAKEKPNVHF